MRVNVRNANRAAILFCEQRDASPGHLGQAVTASACVLDDLPAHAGIPVTSQMIRDVLRRLPGILSGKERGDFVDHLYEMMWVHNVSPASAADAHTRHGDRHARSR